MICSRVYSIPIATEPPSYKYVMYYAFRKVPLGSAATGRLEEEEEGEEALVNLQHVCLFVCLFVG